MFVDKKADSTRENVEKDASLPSVSLFTVTYESESGVTGRYIFSLVPSETQMVQAEIWIIYQWL